MSTWIASLMRKEGVNPPCEAVKEELTGGGYLIDGVQRLPRMIIGHSKIPCYACYCTTILLSVVRDRSW